MLAETRRKSLPRLGKTVHADSQALHHFLAHAEWSVEAVCRRRLELLRQALGQTPFIRCLDETGDRKKGHTTDYVASQYIGTLPALANGIVSVNANGVVGITTFPLLFRMFKPQTRRKAGDVYKTKPQRAVAIIRDHPRSSAIIRDHPRSSAIIRDHRGTPGCGVALQRRLGRESLWRQRPVSQRAAPPARAVCRGHSVQSRRLDAAGPAHSPHALAPL